VLHSDNKLWPISESVKRLSEREVTSDLLEADRTAWPVDRRIESVAGRGALNRKAAAIAAALITWPGIGTYLSSSPLEDDGLGEVSPAECPHDGAGLAAAGLGAAQLGAAGGGVAAGLGAGAGLGADIGAAGLGAGGLAAGAAFFFAAVFLAPAFLADFFGAAAFDFLADFFADFLAFFADFFADFLADFFEDFFADFFFIRLFLAFLAFLLFLLFFALAILILLLPPINVYRAFQVVRLSSAGPIDQFNPGRGPPVAQSRSSIVCTTGTDVPPAI
jgi:hypothetical protein